MDVTPAMRKEMARRRIYAVISDPCSSYWLRGMLTKALQRDPVDVANDMEFARELLTEYWSPCCAHVA